MDLAASAWHDVALSNIGRGSDALQVTINGSASEFTSTGVDTELDLKTLEGPLYIGGHSNIVAIQVLTVRPCVFSLQKSLSARDHPPRRYRDQ